MTARIVFLFQFLLCTVLSAQDPNAVGAVSQKLTQITIAKVQLNDMAVADVIAWLNTNAKASDPAGQGVAFRMKAGVAAPDVRLTLSLTRVPLGEVVRYVTGLANMKSEVTATGVEFTVAPAPAAKAPGAAGAAGAGGGGEFFTKEYAAVPPEFFGKTMPRSVKDYLQAKGVPFPEGAAAIYVVSRKALVVKTTNQGLGIVNGLVEEWKKAPRQPGR